MSENKQRIIEAYSTANEKDRAELSGEYGMEFLYTKKFMDEYINPNTELCEIGCGGGYYSIYYADKCKSYFGVDISPENIGAFNKTIKEKNLSNVKAEIADATHLNNIQDDSFDVVLCLGPMYHLNRQDRLKCISECRRICKEDGIIAFAYINKIGAIVKVGIMSGFQNVLTDKISESVLDNGVDDLRPDLFFYTMPEEISADANAVGLEVINNVGLDVILDDQLIESLDVSQREVWFKMADLMNTTPSCVGMSNHALLICRK